MTLTLGVLSTITLFIALDGKHYWHEVRFMYASSQLSLHEIISGVFNPHQIGGRIDEVGAGGFYLAKVLHISLLKMIFGIVPPNKGGLILSIALSVIIIGLTALLTFMIFSRFFNNPIRSYFAACCFMMMPIIPYLAGKLLSEVTSLFFVSFSVLAFVRVFRKERENIGFHSMLSGIFLVLTALSRLDMVLCFIGFFIACLICSENARVRKNILIGGIIVTVIFLLGELLVVILLGKDIYPFILYFQEFVRAETKSNIMSILGILTFGGLVYIPAFGALLSPEKKKFVFLAIWFVASAGIAMLITMNYMVEPRYLASGILPLAGLGAIGLDNFLQKIPQNGRKIILITTFITFVTLFNIVTVKLMPYELDRYSITKAADNIFRKDANAVILIPYAYTDFHFLQVMMPSAPIYNVNNPKGENNLLLEKWRQRLKRWYGNAYLDDEKVLKSFVLEKPVYYLGWRRYPPVEFVMKVAESFGIRKLVEFLDSLSLKNHLTESWVWNDPAYNLKMAGKCGQYEYYRVTLARRKGF